MKNVLTPTIFKLIFLQTIFGFLFVNPLLSQTLADIQSRVGKNNISTSKPISQRKKQNIFEINSVRPGNIKNYKVNTDNGGYVNLLGVEISFKINEKGDEFLIPYAFCYFYDKDKNLLDRKTIDFIYAKNSMFPKPFETVLTVEGKLTTRVVCSYPANFSFKYVVCVLGNKENIDVMCYPRSANPEEFDFDEKEMLKK